MAFILCVKVTPNASKNQVVDWKDNVLSLRIKGVPEKGKVNQELVSFLSKEWKIAKSQIEIISGHTSRLKRLKISCDELPFLEKIMKEHST